ncbi:MAG: autotransporter domain-containing protein [Deltaproteobacteria bacterium]|nr:autotransporter domain-containing protein [Deltaproteobacteria bacterium]
MRKHLGTLTAFLLGAALALAGPAAAGQYNQFVVFGDSTLDTGYFRYHTTGDALVDEAVRIAISRGAKGGWAGNGEMNTTILAGKFGLNADTVEIGGTNYANGGATSVPNDKPIMPANVATVQQIANYLDAVGGRADSQALYLIKSGDNDATYYTNQGAAWRAAHPNYLAEGAAALAEAVARLQAAGARTIVVRNSYDAAIFAGVGGDIAPENAEAYGRSVGLWRSEWTNLTARGVRFIPADNDSLFSYIVHNPTKFGFTAETVLAANAPSPVSALVSILTPEQQRGYLFIDGVHVTTAGQTIEADYVYNLLVAPSQISLIAESAVHSVWARTATIQEQIELSGQHRGPNGVNVWTSAGVSRLKLDNESGLPDASGTPFGGTVGVDYQTGFGLLLGAAFSAGGQRQDFSDGGNYGQEEEALSVYAAYRLGPVWGNALASFGQIQNTLSRDAALGILTDENQGDTNGQSQALALRVGGDIHLGPVTTGPVVGMVLQQVYLNGFTESGGTGLTALAFGGQTRDSVISQLGWRVAVDVGDWQPFAEAKWNHEFADTDRTVTAMLTTTDAPSYEVDAAPVGEDWATASLGASYRLNSWVTLLGSLSAMLGNSDAESYGGEVGVNFSF